MAHCVTSSGFITSHFISRIFPSAPFKNLKTLPVIRQLYQGTETSTWVSGQKELCEFPLGELLICKNTGAYNMVGRWNGRQGKRVLSMNSDAKEQSSTFRLCFECGAKGLSHPKSLILEIQLHFVILPLKLQFQENFLQQSFLSYFYKERRSSNHCSKSSKATLHCKPTQHCQATQRLSQSSN